MHKNKEFMVTEGLPVTFHSFIRKIRKGTQLFQVIYKEIAILFFVYSIFARDKQLIIQKK